MFDKNFQFEITQKFVHFTLKDAYVEYWPCSGHKQDIKYLISSDIVAIVPRSTILKKKQQLRRFCKFISCNTALNYTIIKKNDNKIHQNHHPC